MAEGLEVIAVVTKFLIEPLSSLLFREARPFSPVARGPVANARTLRFPNPSTVAGLLAQKAWIEGLCTGSPHTADNYFGATYECLRKLLGEDFNLKGPFLVFERKILVNSYEGPLLLPDRKKLEHTSRVAKGEEEPKRKQKVLFDKEDIARTEERVGVWLRRHSKVVRGVVEGGEASLYVQTRLHLKNGAKYLVEDLGNSSATMDWVAVFGRGGLVRVKTKSGSSVMEWLKELWGTKDSGECLVYLVTPMVLEGVPQDYLNSPERLAEEIKRALNFSVNAVSVYPHKTSVRPMSLGWDLSRGVQRPLALVVEPGALFKGYCGDWRNVYEGGAGKYKELGYGTLVPLPLL